MQHVFSQALDARQHDRREGNAYAENPDQFIAHCPRLFDRPPCFTISFPSGDADHEGYRLTVG